MSNESKRSKAIRTAFDNNKLTIYAPKLPTSKFQPNLKTSFWQEQPQLQASTGVEGEWIRVGYSLRAFNAYLRILEYFATGKLTGKVIQKAMTGALNAKEQAGMVVIGRDAEEGETKDCIYVAVLSTDPNVSRIKFFFQSDDYHPIMVDGKNPIGRAIDSEIAVLSYIDTHRQLLAQAVKDTYNPDADPANRPREGKGGKSDWSGKNDYQGNTKSSNSSARESFDADDEFDANDALDFD